MHCTALNAICVAKFIKQGLKAQKQKSFLSVVLCVACVNVKRCLFSPRVPQVLLTIHYVPAL